MDNDTAQRKFNIAKNKFLEGLYEESLVLLDELIEKHPGVFNLDYAKLQCLKRLERIQETKDLHLVMSMNYVQPDQLEKLKMVGEWIAEQENSGLAGLGGLDFESDFGGPGLMDDILGLSPPKRKKEETRPAPAAAHQSHNKAIAIILLIGAVAAAAAWFLPALLKPTPPFSAGVIIGLPYGNMEGKFYRKTNRVTRTELMGQVVITNEDRVYVLIPSERKYSIMTVADVMGNSFLSEIDDFDSWIAARKGSKIGEEVLYGLNCDVYQGQMSFNPGMPPSDTKVWWSRDLEFLVKSETIGKGLLSRMVMFLKDIKVGPLPEDLFQVPRDYTQVSPQETMDLGANMGIGFGPGVGEGIMGASKPVPGARMNTLPPSMPSAGINMPTPTSTAGVSVQPPTMPSTGMNVPPPAMPSTGMNVPPPSGYGTPYGGQQMNQQQLEQIMQQLRIQQQRPQ